MIFLSVRFVKLDFSAIKSNRFHNIPNPLSTENETSLTK